MSGGMGVFEQELEVKKRCLHSLEQSGLDGYSQVTSSNHPSNLEASRERPV